MRNNQFNILSQDFLEHQDDRSNNDKVLMLWDFNVSPWSIYYKKLDEWLVGLANITRNFTILFTWSVKYLPFLQTHIDHVFVSDNVVVWNVEKVDTPGSDHKWFFIENIR
jgi:endonuclease/exonuclease/phosphatase (EEP) superfamily protein YafD